MYTLKKNKERIILVGLKLPTQKWRDVEDSLEELRLLTYTAGGEVVGEITQARTSPDSKTFIGHGKVEELNELCETENAKTIIFDDDLKPGQALNLARITGKKIVDRSGLILDIFSRRAKTNAAKTQVELAQLEYLLPRLTRRWSHLARQQGGIGTRGPGEKQIEMDRRQIQRRIATLKERLSKIEQQRKTRRLNRQNVKRVALIGYTNAGKSTFLNQIADADVFTEDKLFATLDPTTRKVQNRSGYTVLFTDTVGFIKKLPHHLIESFKSTLAEAQEAELLVHIVDITNKANDNNIKVVTDILTELKISNKSTLLIFNKIDLLDRNLLDSYYKKHPDAFFISAKTGEGIEETETKVFAMLFKDPYTPHWKK